jgi:hypothetical protein
MNETSSSTTTNKIISYIHNHTSYRITTTVPPKLEIYDNELQQWQVATMTTTTLKRNRGSNTRHERSSSVDNTFSDTNTSNSFQRALQMFASHRKGGSQQQQQLLLPSLQIQQVEPSTTIPSTTTIHKQPNSVNHKLPYIPIQLLSNTITSHKIVSEQYPFRQLPEDTIYYILSFMESCFDQHSNFDLSHLYGKFSNEIRFMHPNIALNSNTRYLYGKRKGFQKGTMRLLLYNVVNIKFYGSRMNRFLLQFFGALLNNEKMKLPMLRSIKLPMHVTSTVFYRPVITATAPVLPPPPTFGLMLPTPAIGTATITNPVAQPLGLLNLLPIYDLMIKSDNTSSDGQEDFSRLTYKSLLSNIQILSVMDLQTYGAYFDNIVDLRLKLQDGETLSVATIQTVMKHTRLKRLRIESDVQVDAPPNFFKMVLTRSTIATAESQDEQDDIISPMNRSSSSLQILELENIYLIGSVLLGIDVTTCLQYLSIRYTCSQHHMFVLGRGDAILLNRNRSLRYLTGDLSLTPEFLIQFKSETLRVLQLSPKFVAHVITSSNNLVSPPPPPPSNHPVNKLTSVIASGTVNSLINGLMNGKGTLQSSHDQRIPLSQFLKCPNMYELYIHYDQVDFGLTSENGLQQSIFQLQSHCNLKRVIFYTNSDVNIGNTTNVSTMDSLTISTTSTSVTHHVTNKVQVICELLNSLIPNIEFLIYNSEENNSLGQMQLW